MAVRRGARAGPVVELDGSVDRFAGYLTIMMLFVPFGMVMVRLANALVVYFDGIEQLNGIPLP